MDAKEQPIKKGPSVHYAPYGEWGGERVNCNRYFTSDVANSGVWSKVTCKHCLKNKTI